MRLVQRPLSTLLRIFVTGALAALPLAATILIFVWAAGVLIKWLGPESAVGGLLVSIGLGVGGSEVVGYALGIAIVAAALFGLGLLVEAGLQRGIAAALHALIARIPVVGTIYDLIKKFVALVRPGEAGSEGALKSMSAVWCHFGGPGGSAALALLGREYSANAYPFSPRYQNCNQWVAELLATAWRPAGAAGWRPPVEVAR